MTSMPIEDLKPYYRNARRGSVETIVESLRSLGQYRPIVVNRGSETGRPWEVLAGNHTLRAAAELGWEQIDVHEVDVDEDTAAKIVLVDNRSNDVADYDREALLELLDDVPDLVATGYTAEDLDELRIQVDQERDPTEVGDDADDAPPAPEDPVTRPGDVWQLGQHRLVCGDSTEAGVLADLLDGEVAECIWTDPPYGVEYVGKTKEALRIQNDGAAGLEALLTDAFTRALTVTRPGSAVYVAHADTERMTFEGTLRRTGYLVRQNLVWVKNTIVLGRSDYHYKHEPVLVAEAWADESTEDPEEPAEEPAGGETEAEVRQHEPILYGFTPGAKGRLGRGGPRWYGDNAQATVFDVPKPPANRDHPTMKPVELITRMLDNSLRPGAIVLDMFGGSGSTLIAAELHGSRAYLSEIDPRYCDVIVRRWAKMTGGVPERQDGPVDFLDETTEAA